MKALDISTLLYPFHFELKQGIDERIEIPPYEHSKILIHLLHTTPTLSTNKYATGRQQYDRFLPKIEFGGHNKSMEHHFSDWDTDVSSSNFKQTADDFS